MLHVQLISRFSPIQVSVLWVYTVRRYLDMDDLLLAGVLENDDVMNNGRPVFGLIRMVFVFCILSWVTPQDLKLEMEKWY